MEVSNNCSTKTFHIINENKCLKCQTFECENVCFRGIYKVINKDLAPKCIIVKDKEPFCVKCHLCTTACKQKAIEIL